MNIFFWNHVKFALILLHKLFSRRFQSDKSERKENNNKLQNYLELESMTSEAGEQLNNVAPPPPLENSGSLLARRKIRPLSEPIFIANEVQYLRHFS